MPFWLPVGQAAAEAWRELDRQHLGGNASLFCH